MAETFEDVDGEPSPGSALDQAGLLDGEDVVSELLEHGDRSGPGASRLHDLRVRVAYLDVNV